MNCFLVPQISGFFMATAGWYPPNSTALYPLGFIHPGHEIMVISWSCLTNCGAWTQSDDQTFG